MKRVNVYSHQEFNNICETENICDNNVESLTDKAFISIVGTEECRKYYLEDETSHWFNEEHTNVINLQFDDLTEDFMWKGHLFKAMKQDDADRLLKFIIANLGKEFNIHCLAGQSRSQGVARFIVDCFQDYDESSLRQDNPCLTPNRHVLRLLKRSLYELLENDEKITELLKIRDNE